MFQPTNYVQQSIIADDDDVTVAEAEKRSVQVGCLGGCADVGTWIRNDNHRVRRTDHPSRRQVPAVRVAATGISCRSVILRVNVSASIYIITNMLNSALLPYRLILHSKLGCGKGGKW